ncbi:hypothetical protein D1872_262210 [compost metagenome]
MQGAGSHFKITVTNADLVFSEHLTAYLLNIPLDLRLRKLRTAEFPQFLRSLRLVRLAGPCQLFHFPGYLDKLAVPIQLGKLIALHLSAGRLRHSLDRHDIGDFPAAALVQ